MKFTPAEEKMVARLRKQNARAKKWRWANLVTAGISIVPYFYWVFSLSDIAEKDFPVMIFVRLFCMILAMPWLMVGGLLLAKTIWEWNGNPTTTLLLKLLDDKKDAPE